MFCSHAAEAVMSELLNQKRLVLPNGLRVGTGQTSAGYKIHHYRHGWFGAETLRVSMSVVLWKHL